MAKRSQADPAERRPLRLSVSIDDARARLADRVAKGRALKELTVSSWESLEEAKKAYSKWNAYNHQLLKQMFTTYELATEYYRSLGGALFVDRNLAREIHELHEDVDSKIHRLESITERLELIPLSDSVDLEDKAETTSSPSSSNRVFVVHGHDEAIREAVARFLERLELEPIILHEQANEGLTVIEKLERYSDVRFSVILLTPDDDGRATAGDGVLRPRARQNVILELGYFIAKLGRKSVCALHRGALELPSDYLGVVYVAIDEGGGWQLRLAKELRAAGFLVDMNKAL